MNKGIFIKYFTGELSINEEIELLNWIDASDTNRKAFFQERKLWDMILLNSSGTTQPEMSKLDIENKGKTINKKNWIFEFSKIAAIFVFAALLGGWLTMKFSDKPQAWNTIEVPVGQRTNLRLSDGTNVWLNAKSKFSFPDKFKDGVREVKLDGEALFDVVHNEKSNFIVKTKQFDVRVLGTKFNVYAYNNSPTFETALLRGKVLLDNKSSKYEQVTLETNQVAVYNSKSGTVEINRLENNECIFWTEGVYSFNNQSLSSVIQRLERYYEVKIIVTNPDILNYKFTGKFRYSDSINIILEVIRRMKFFKYAQDGNQITIYK